MYFGMEIGLKDMFSQVANRVEGSMARLQTTAGNTVSSINKQLGAIGVGTVVAGVGITLATFFGDAVKAAGMFSDKYADIRKTANLTEEEVRRLSSSFEQLDTRTSLVGLLDIAKVGGAVGVTGREMQGFVESTNMAVVALGDEFAGGVEGVVKPLGTLKNLFAETKNLDFGTAINRVGSAINQLGSEGLATGGNIAEFTARIGQLGNMAPNIAQTMGLGAALEELGLSAQIASGGVTNIMLMAGQNISEYAKQLRMTDTEFKSLMNSSPNDMFLQLAASMQGASSTQIVETMKRLKIGTQESIKVMNLLANQTDLVKKRQESASRAFAEATSLQNEYGIKNETLGAAMEKMSNKVEILMKSIGEQIAPAFTPLFSAMSSLLSWLNEFIKTPAGRVAGQIAMALAGLATVLGTGVVAVATFQLAMNGLGLSFSGLIATGVSPFITAYNFMVTTVMARTAAMQAFMLASFARVRLFMAGLSNQFVVMRLQAALAFGVIQNRALSAIAAMRSFSIATALASIRVSFFNAVTGVMNGLRNLPATLMSGARAMGVFGLNALRTAGSVMLTTVAIGTLLAPLLVIGAAVAFAYKSWQSFDELLEKTAKGEYVYILEGGLVGTMRRFGGVLRGVWEILKSVNSEGFSLPENVYNALQGLGIADFVIALGTYAVRAYAFFEGFMAGFSSLKGVFEPFWASMKQLADVVFNSLEKLGYSFGNATGEVSNFTAMGSTIANAILFPLKLGISLITWFAEAVLYLENNFGVLSFAVNIVVGIFEKMFAVISSIFNLIRELPIIGEQISKLFPKENLAGSGGTEAFNSMFSTGNALSNPTGAGMGNLINVPNQSTPNFNAVNTVQNPNSVASLQQAEKASTQRAANNTQKQNALLAQNANTKVVERTETVKNINTQIVLDNRVIGEAVTSYQKEQNALGGA